MACVLDASYVNELNRCTQFESLASNTRFRTTDELYGPRVDLSEDLNVERKEPGESTPMDEDRIVGTARNIAGKAQESLGRVVGDAKTQAQGVANQVKGTAQDLYGQAREGASQVASETATAARQTASSLESSLRDFIETQPYTAVFVALGIGWLLGRTHRPL